MNRHIPEEVLADFVKGALDEGRAIEVGLHIDDCPLCASRAVVLEPLSPAFAAVDDPVLPIALRERVEIALSARPQAQPVGLVPWLGLGLIASAAMLLVLAGEPAGLAKQGLTLLYALGVGLGALVHNLPAQSTLLPTTAVLVVFFCLSAIRLLGIAQKDA